MTNRKEKARRPEVAESESIDAKYAAEEAEAQRQLIEATAGPGKHAGCVAGPVPCSMPPDGAELKNPHE